jgi:hypothetical protein
LFDGTDSHCALLDLSGEILAVNSAWIAYGVENGLSPSSDPVGQNYLHICESAAEQQYPGAMEAYLGLQQVLRANRPKFTMVYRCHSPSVRRWYRMWVEPQFPDVPVVVVAHKLVSEKPIVPPDAPFP